MAESFAKKEKEKKKAKKRQDKEEKKEERKANNSKGKSLEEMIVYLDEYGNLTDISPDKQIRKKVNSDDEILEMYPPTAEKSESNGIVSLYFNDKGYGFITEDKTRANIFVHNSKLMEVIEENDKVAFKKEKTARGYHAVDVRKL